MSSNKPLKFILSGGGTGGHIYPALAIADALKAHEPDAQFLFVGAKNRMEMTKVPEAGYEIRGLNITGLDRSASWRNLAVPFRAIGSLLRAGIVLDQFKPDCVIGTGGYASGPVMFAASSRRIPTVVQEQNAFPGLTNKLLGGRVTKICVAYEGLETFFPKQKLVLTGTPVRPQLFTYAGTPGEARQFFGLQPDVPTVLVVGGSLGARSINEAMLAGLPQFEAAGVQVIWHTGTRYYDEMAAVVHPDTKPYLHLAAYLGPMEIAYRAASVVVSRAGAGSIAELAALAKPAILVPSPNVADDHQTKNALALTAANAAEVVADADALSTLPARALALATNATRLLALREAIAPIGRRDAANAIAQEILKLARAHAHS